MSIPAAIGLGEDTVTATCAECGAQYVRRVLASRAKWCPKCAQARRDAAVIRWNSTRRVKESDAKKSERAALAAVRQENQPMACARSPESYVPGPERIAEIEGRCRNCGDTYWTLDARKRSASMCDRCAR